MEKSCAARRKLVKAEDRCQCCIEAAKEEGEDDEDDQGPPGQTALAGIVRCLSHGEGDDENAEVPPSRNLLVDLKLDVVRVVHEVLCLVPRVEREEEGLDLGPATGSAQSGTSVPQVCLTILTVKVERTSKRGSSERWWQTRKGSRRADRVRS